MCNVMREEEREFEQVIKGLFLPMFSANRMPTLDHAPLKARSRC